MKKLSFASIALLISFVGLWEGQRTTAYQDIVGVWTVCNGHTQGVKRGDTYTKAECDTMLANELERFNDQLAPCITGELSQGERIALTSLAYNVGVSGVCKSTALRKMNAGDRAGGCEALKRFSCVTLPAGKGDKTGQCANKKRTGKFVQGLHNRRLAEEKICLAI